MTDPSIDHRLAVYGTLLPGRSNHHQVSELEGRWVAGTVRGTLLPNGWGAALGYPGVILDPHGAVVEVQVLESTMLPQHWPRLDAFEGPGYRRVVAEVATSEGAIAAWIYALSETPGRGRRSGC